MKAQKDLDKIAGSIGLPVDFEELDAPPVDNTVIVEVTNAIVVPTWEGVEGLEGVKDATQYIGFHGNISRYYERGKPHDMLAAMANVGALEEGDLTVYDICGGAGVSLAYIAMIREQLNVRGNFTGVCIDNDPRNGRFFQGIMGKIGLLEKLRFDLSDAKSASVDRSEGQRTLWLAEHPNGAIVDILEHTRRLTSDTMPDGIVIMPCSCHGYMLDQYPDRVDDPVLISTNKWTELIELLDRFWESDHEACKRIMRYIDLLRAKCLAEQTPALSASMVLTPRQKDPAIIVRPKRN